MVDRTVDRMVVGEDAGAQSSRGGYNDKNTGACYCLAITKSSK